MLSAPPMARSAETLYLAGFGGSFQKAFEERIIPAFEAKTGTRVVYVPGNSTDTVAKLIAQKGKSDLSLAIVDDGPMYQALEQNLCASLEGVPAAKDVYPAARMPGGKAVGFGFYAIGLAYNKDGFAKNGWKAPTSWNDLGDPKYKGKVAMGSISSYGMVALPMIARANGGSEEKIEPGFDAMINRIAPNVLAWENSPAKMAQMLQTGEAALVVWGSTRVQAAIEQGAPLAFVYPKEGAAAGMVTACVVNGAPRPKLAQALLEEILSPAAQIVLAQVAGFGPANSKVKLEPDVAKKVVYGPEQANALVPLNWTVVNRDRSEWAKRWNREVER
ncbi:MAG: ABC transporter substrate-binding protein [Ideonella sp.]|nr:ABC transporter substrate-binding protein [Ideonella sp.]